MNTTGCSMLLPFAKHTDRAVAANVVGRVAVPTDGLKPSVRPGFRPFRHGVMSEKLEHTARESDDSRVNPLPGGGLRAQSSYSIPPIRSPTVQPSRNVITNTLPPVPVSLLLPGGHQPDVGPNGWVTTDVLRGSSIRDGASQFHTSRALVLSDPSSGGIRLGRYWVVVFGGGVGIKHVTASPPPHSPCRCPSK